MYFASDNSGPAHPRVMQALSGANAGYAASYGDDALMQQVRAEIRDQFEAPEAAVYLVATGTAANVLALATLGQPWQRIYCTPVAHIAVDEANGPEFYTGGAKLTEIAAPDGKMSGAALAAAIAQVAPGDVHHPQPGVLSLTNLTEMGTAYSPAEIGALSALARAHGMAVHLDGARLANALAATGASPAEMTWKAGVDALSLGATKNGCLGVEAVVLFDPARAWEFELRRKRGGHLLSKHRYLSAQMAAYLEAGLWRDLAGQANAAGARLAAALAAAGAEFVSPAQANMIFARVPRATHRRLFAAGAVYHLWGDTLDGGDDPDEMLAARLVCDWSTTDEQIEAFLSHLTA